MIATIKDVAKRAGVSHSTVSRALNDNPLISPLTAQRVRQAALELGYHPSAAARSLKTNQTQALGVVVSNIDDPFFSEILQGIEEVAQNQGYSLFISASQRDTARERTIVQVMREHRLDAVIICSTSFSASQSRQLLDQGIPIVVINNQAAEEYRYSIFHDDVDGCRQVTRHLIELGHCRIAYLGNRLSGRTTLDRLAGFQQEMDAHNLPVLEEYIYQVDGSEPQNGFAGAGYFLGLQEPPTALVCYNDTLAIGALQRLQQAGVRVPEQCSVTGFDNIVFSAFTNPPLTTLDQPKHFIGAEAARLVLSLLTPAGRSTTSKMQSLILKGALLVRQSSAPPPA